MLPFLLHGSSPRAVLCYHKLDGAQKARLVALTCSTPPEGRVRWTLQLLADRLVELEVGGHDWPGVCADHAKKNDLKPWQKKQWVIPPKANAAFVFVPLEDVLGSLHPPLRPAAARGVSG